MGHVWRTAAWDKGANEAANVRLEPTEMSPKYSSLLLLEDISLGFASSL